MKIGVVGSNGVVGGANKAGFISLGHDVYEHDRALNTDIKNILNTEICYVCVPSPSLDDGTCDTSIVEEVIAEMCSLDYAGVIAIRSTVEPGFTSRTISKYNNERICFVPEFLRERCALEDFLDNHAVCVVGTENDEVYDVVRESHGEVPQTFRKLTPSEAELVKYFNNVYAALRVTFANNMFTVCDALGAKYSDVKDTYLLTGKSSGLYIDVSDSMRGYAGMCLPKDTRALIALIRKLNLDLELIPAIEIDNAKVEKTVFAGMRL